MYTQFSTERGTAEVFRFTLLTNINYNVPNTWSFSMSISNFCREDFSKKFMFYKFWCIELVFSEVMDNFYFYQKSTILYWFWSKLTFGYLFFSKHVYTFNGAGLTIFIFNYLRSVQFNLYFKLIINRLNTLIVYLIDSWHLEFKR